MGALGIRTSGGGTPVKNAKEKFIELELRIEEASLMNSKLGVIKNNRAADALIKIFKYFEENREEASRILGELLEHENCFVCMGAASHCLALGIRAEQALVVLNEVAQNATSRYAKGVAKAVLMVYEQQGYLTMYQGQQIYKPE